MTIPDHVMDQVAQIVLDGDQRRAGASERFLDSLTISELILVCESAVAGYIAGAGAAATDRYPGDLTIKVSAFTRCRVEPERFPRIGTASTVATLAFFDTLPARDQWLVHEAMVMGYVLGKRYRSVRRAEKMPSDEAIVHTVVQHCQSTSDIYPVIGENVSELVWKIVKNNAGRAHATAVVAVVEKLLPGRGHAAADSIIDLLDGGQLTDTTDGLTIVRFENEAGEQE